MSRNKIRRFLSVLIVNCMVIQVILGTGIKGVDAASNGAITYGADGITSYLLNHENVKELDINTGNIIITDTGYEQANGNKENWDAITDAYVIKGQGTSKSTITIQNYSDTVVNIYLVDTQWNGYIYYYGNVNLIICGNVKNDSSSFSGFSFLNANGNSKGEAKIIGYNNLSNIEVDSLFNNNYYNSNYAVTLEIKDIKINANYLFKNSKMFHVLTVENSTIAGTNYNNNNVISYVQTINFNNSNVSNIRFSNQTCFNLNIINSKLNNFYIMLRKANLDDCFMDNVNLRYSNENTQKIISINNSVARNSIIGGYNPSGTSKIVLHGSTIISSGINQYTQQLIFDNSSSSETLQNRPVNSSSKNVYLKKIKFREHPNTYVLTTYEDGTKSKLLTDSNGYLNPYLIENSSKLDFQLTDEKGEANYGTYKLEFEPLTSDDSNATEPERLTAPTTVTFEPYSEVEIEYSFDKINWTSVITDTNAQFKTVLPNGVKKIYLRYDGKLYQIDVYEDGSLSSPVPITPTIIEQSGKEEIALGETATLYVTATPYNKGILSYTWIKNGEELPGKNSNVLSIKDIKKEDSGIYQCIVQESDVGSIISEPMQLIVSDGDIPTEFKIIGQSESKELIKGDNTEFYVLAQPAEGVTYQWFKDTVSLEGANSYNYKVTDAKLSDSGSYTCKVTCDEKIITSEPIVLQVINNPLDEEISNLNQAVKLLTTEVNNLKEQLNSANAEKENLNQIISEKGTEIENLKNQISHLNQEKAAIEAQLQDANKDKAELIEQVEKLTAQVTSLNNQLQESKEALETANNERLRLEQTIKELNLNIQNLTNQVANLKSRLEESEGENEELRNQITNLQTTITGLQNDVLSLQGQVGELKNTNQSLLSQIQDLAAQNKTLQNDVKQLETLLEEANKTIGNLTEQVNKLTNQVDTLTKDLQQANADKESLNQTISEKGLEIENLKNQINNLNQEKAAIEAQLQDANKDKAALIEQVGNLTNQVTSLNKELQDSKEALETANNERLRLEQTITDLNLNIQNLTNQVDSLKSRLEESEGEKEELRNQVTNLQKTITGLQNDALNLQDQVEELKNTNQSLLTQIYDLNQQNTMLKNDVKQLESLLKEANETIGNLTEQVNKLTNQVDTLTKDLYKANTDKESLKQIISEKGLEIENLKNQISNLEQEKAAIEAQLQNANNGKAELIEQVGNLTTQVTSLNSQLQDSKKALEEASNERVRLEQTISELNLNIQNLTTQVASLKNRLEESEGENEELRNQVSYLQKLISGQQSDVVDLKNQIEELKNTNQSLLMQIYDLNQQNTKLKDDVKQLESLLREANETIGNLTEQVNKLTNQVDTLTQDLYKASTEKESLNQIISEKGMEVKNLKNQINNLEQQKTEIEGKLQDAYNDKAKMVKQVESLNNQVTFLNKQLQNSKKTLEEANDKRMQLEQMVYDLNQTISNLKSKVSTLESKLEISEGEKGGLRNQIKTLQKTITELENDVIGLRGQVKELKNTNQNLLDELAIAKNTINSMNLVLTLIKTELGVTDNNEIVSAIQYLKKQLDQEQTNNNLLKEQVTELDNKLDDAKESNKKLVKKLDELSKFAGAENDDEIQSRVVELKTTLTQSQTSISTLEKERINLLKQLENATTENNALQKQIDDLLALYNQDVAELKKQINSLTEKFNKVVIENADLQKSVEELNTKVIELSSDKTTLEGEILRLQTLLETANGTIDELKDKVISLVDENQLLRNNNAVLKAEIENLKMQHSTSSYNLYNYDYLSDLTESKNKLQKTLQELDTTKKELGNARSELEKATEEIKNKESLEVPENAVVIVKDEILPKTVLNEVISEQKKPITKNKITAQDGWEISTNPNEEWSNEIDIVEAAGQSNVKNEVVALSFYAREKDEKEVVHNYTVDIQKPVAIPNLSMSKSIYLGSKFKLNVANAPDDIVKYESSNKGIIKISKDGTIIPLKEGKTKVTGNVIKNDIPYKFTVNVNVKKGKTRTLNLKDQAIQSSAKAPVLTTYKMIYKGKKSKINLTGYAKDATVSYLSADSNVATVNSNGTIHGLKKGSTTITAILTQNNVTYTYIIKVRVNDGTVDKTMWEYLSVS